MSKRKIQAIDPADNEPISTPTSKRTKRIIEEVAPPKLTPKKSTSTSKAATSAKHDTPKTVRTQETPKSRRTDPKRVYSTPQKPIDDNGKKVYIVSNADRSARRRSARNLIEQTVTGELSDEETLGDQSLAQEIRQEHQSDSELENGEDEDAQPIEAETPSKSATKLKTSKRKRSPTPPADLPPHERYFYDNRPSGAKTSANSLKSSDLISHAFYHQAVSNAEDTHATNIDDLHEHHASSFPLWTFELSQQFSLYLYGYGSKRKVLTAFATYLHDRNQANPPTIVMVNGTHPDLTLKSLLTTIAEATLPVQHTKLPAQPQHIASMIQAHLTDRPPPAPIYLLLSALHAKAITTPQSLSILADLSAHRSIHLVVTADNPNIPILFPVQLRAMFNFLFHDTTTFVPYDRGTRDSELSTVVDSVLELIGRKTSAAAGREGVKWVLKSLPENARGLYRILVSEILAAAEEGSAPAFDTQPDQPLGEEMDIDATPSKGRASRSKQSSHGLPGIDAKILYQKAVEEFLCSSETMFWSLLKEFVDHRMVLVRKERGLAGGGEMLGVEIGKDELEGVLEDLLE